MSKTKLRQTAQNVRRKLSISEQDAPREAAAQFLAHIQPSAAQVVACYWPLRDELDSGPLIRELLDRNIRIALPRVPAKKGPLTFHIWTRDDPLVPGPFNLREPEETAPRVTPDIVVTPLLAFDRQGTRLGYGGGYYDRTISALREERKIMVVGYAYAGQEVPSLPAESHDHALDAIVTEREVIMIQLA